MYIILDSISPVRAVILLECALNRYRPATGDFFKVSDKLIRVKLSKTPDVAAGSLSTVLKLLGN